MRISLNGLIGWLAVVLASSFFGCGDSLGKLAEDAAEMAEAIPQKLPIYTGLVVELNADTLVCTNKQGEVLSWTNTVSSSAIQAFEPSDEGVRSSKPGSGRPQLISDTQRLNGHLAIAFREDELINQEEDALDHLLTGNGYTWVVVLRPFLTQDPDSTTEFGQDRLRDVNTFMGNLRNSDKYEGFWGNLEDDLTVWCGSRSGVTFGRFDDNNPKVSGPKIDTSSYHIIAARMGAGVDTVSIELYVDNGQAAASGSYPVSTATNPSKLAIGTERDATNHPGAESFDGAITRLMIYERPLEDAELQQLFAYLRAAYGL